jgi:hypothetical protein
MRPRVQAAGGGANSLARVPQDELGERTTLVSRCYCADKMGVTQDRAQRGISRRSALVLLGALALCLAAGILVFGIGTDAGAARAAPRAIASTVDGCQERALRYEVTDDPRVRDAQRQLEFSPLPPLLPEPGLHRAPLDPIASLHAVVHGSVAVYFRTDLGERQADALAELTRRAIQRDVPLLVSPRAQHAALVAVRSGVQLTCTAARKRQVERLRAFTAAQFPALAR